MKILQNIDETKCKHVEMQIRQNTFGTRWKCNKLQMRHNTIKHNKMQISQKADKT